MKKLFLLIALLWSAPAWAGTYWVSQSGSNGNACTDTTTPQTTGAKLTLTAGLTCLKGAGDTLYLRGGTYHERILYTQLIPSGTAGNPVTIRNYPGETVWLDGTNSTNVPLINMANTTSGGGGPNPALRYIVFDGINLDCFNVSGGDACVGTSPPDTSSGGIVTDHITWQNYEAKNTNSTNNIPGGFAPVHIINGNFHTFRNCYVHDSGLTPKPVDNFGGYAFYINGDDHVIDHCIMDRLGGYGVQAFKSSTIDKANRITISNNKISNTGLNSIGTTTGGIVIGSGAGHKVFNNTISTGFDGIEINYTCTDCAVVNNTIYNSSSAGMTIAATVVRPIVTNNILVNSGVVNISNEGASSPSINSNLCFGSGGSSLCAITADPLFANASAGNFHLLAGSPAIDKGTPVFAPYNVDIDGNPRPQGGGYDLGASEYGVPIITVAPQLVLALPLDEGTGTIATDVSGQKNNANFVGGVTWDNSGKYGKAIALDGTGYLNIPAAPSLSLAPTMTIEAWIWPTVDFTGHATIIRQDRYYLYAASDAGYCGAPSLAPLGGYSSTTVQNYICATSIPPQGQWSHLAVTHDGLTLTFYLNGNVIASQTSTDAMVPTSYPMTIGASSFGEYFIGKIDQPMVYNYARNPAQILSDMNTPLIGAPGKYVEIAAPVSVEISSAASLEIAAD